MADALKLLASLAQLQASKDPAAAALAQSLQITASGATLTVTVGIPESTLEQLLVHPNGTTARKPVHRM
jgi:deferrochelatase/peroxidase EfeB